VRQAGIDSKLLQMSIGLAANMKKSCFRTLLVPPERMHLRNVPIKRQEEDRFRRRMRISASIAARASWSTFVPPEGPPGAAARRHLPIYGTDCPVDLSNSHMPSHGPAKNQVPA